MKSRSFFGFDILIFASCIALMVIGILFIYSSGVTSTGVVTSNEYIKQIVWMGLGIGILFAIIFSNYSRIGEFSPYIYIVFMLLLVVTLLFGRIVNGARSWIPLFGFGIQPSEFAKIASILYLAYYFDKTKKTENALKRFLIGFAIVLLPMFLILLQPDLGTAIVYLPIFLSICFVSAVPLRYLIYMVLSGSLLMVLTILPAWQTFVVEREYPIIDLISSFGYSWYVLGAIGAVLILSLVGFFMIKKRYFYWILYVSSSLLSAFAGSFFMRRMLEDYQMARLIIFLKPNIDPQGAGYNVLQSITAVGSGGFLGKGWLKGTQSHYKFLPQRSTDFIFSVLAEEWGLIGSLFILMLFLVIIYRGLSILLNARDSFAVYVCAGVIGMFGFHIFINIGMAMGIMPITGIPLFFLSYGGSSLWTALLGIGFLLNIHLRRYRY